MTYIENPNERAALFCKQFEIQVPILMAPMAGACPPQLAIAVANGGGMGACGALLMDKNRISKWAQDVRLQTNGAFQINLWIPDPDPERDLQNEYRVREFLREWGPEIDESIANSAPLDFDAHCDAILAAGPAVISSIMGVYPDHFVARMKEQNIKWFASVTTVTEAIAAQDAGADVIVAQGMEAGGHRGAFDPKDASKSLVGLFSLLPAVVDAVNIPVVATGGIADGRGVAAALILGASAVQIGTGLLRTPEAGIARKWADAIGKARPEGTVATRAYSGRLGRSIETKYVKAAHSADAPEPAPYPIQRNLTQGMRGLAAKDGDIGTMQAWAGQSSMLARETPAAELVDNLWTEAKIFLR